jgi:hypothetical protein
MATNIGRTANSYIATETDGTFSKYAQIGDFITNIPLNSSGAMIITADAGEDEKVVVSDIISDLGKKNGKVKITTGNSFFNFMGPTNSNGFTSIATEPTPFLYTTILSDAAVVTPSVGPTGIVTGTISYDADGANIDGAGKYFSYDWTPQNAGTILFTTKPNHNSGDAVNRYYADEDDPPDSRVYVIYNGSEFTGGRSGVSLLA